ncbi:hypothetical protein KVV02_001164 [Mortierella alpina]|uniref:Uncharacterized protein n=1 Tax=Mortierella alpina TaxID=64518 RepID=A0A9P8AA60_MORAP|nr:hypothetical protein KVV02_001164 [Mortierella alpina]
MPTSTASKAVGQTTAAATPTAAPGIAPGASPTFKFPIPDPSAGANPLGGSGAIYNLPTGTAPFGYPAMPSGAGGGPNDPNFNQGHSTAGGTGSQTNLGLIVGVTVAGVAVLAMAGLMMQRYRARSRTNTINSHQNRSRNKNNQTANVSSGGAGAAGSGGEEDRGDRAKLARSFTIRQPPNVYIEDDQDLDQTGHPRYKSASDALNHPYYGDHHRTPGLVEYELSDTSGQKYGPSSVAERKRYVEQQQRKVMDEYEMFNPHMDAPPTSPYPPSQLTSAPSYTSAATPGPLSPTMTPSMGGRSPRVNHHHPSQSPSPFGRPRHQHDSNDYQY